MLFLLKQKLVFLSVPKTASTAIQHALRPYASIAVTTPPCLKHMSYVDFLRFVAPVIRRDHGLDRQDYTVAAVMREPLSWVSSWYRYRSREELRDSTAPNHCNYSGHVSFSEFARAYCLDVPPPYAIIGDQADMVLSSDGSIGVDRLFPYEHLENTVAFLSDLTGATIALPKLNGSPDGNPTLDAEIETLLLKKLGRAIAIHDRLHPDGRRPL